MSRFDGPEGYELKVHRDHGIGGPRAATSARPSMCSAEPPRVASSMSAQSIGSDAHCKTRGVFVVFNSGRPAADAEGENRTGLWDKTGLNGSDCQINSN
jgi:hypothetical protein